MKKQRIRILAVILAIIMGMTSIGVDAFATTVSGNSISTEENATGNHVSVSDNELEVEGTNSFGKMFAEAIQEKTSEQKKNNGYNIFSMEMNGTEATVKVEALESCTLIAAIYDEDGEQLLAAGAQEVDREDKLVSVSVNVAAENMPSYFYLRGFLVDTYTYRPLCTAYESPNYTQQMQEFFAKTTDDFDANLVLNLDETNDNNFAVYSEDTKVVTDDGVHNQLVQKNEQEMIYVIENADEKITSLTEGDIWAYESDDELIIVKVAHLEADETTVTIYGSESSMEEAFAYIKIDCSEDTEDAVVDASNCDEDIQYLGKQDALSAEGSMTEEVEGDTSTSGSLKYKFLNTNHLSGDLDISIGASIKYYLTFTYQYMEICANYSAEASLSVNGKIGGDGIKLGKIIFAPVPGINLVLSVDFILEFDAKITLDLKWGGSFGSAISSDSDPRDLTSSPKPELDLKGEVTFFVGLKFVPEVQILGENIANAKLEASVGIKVKGTVKLPDAQNGSEQKHNCKLCVNGEINFVSEVKFTAELLAHWKYEYSIAKVTIKIGDWYYSNDLNKFGIFETCDNLAYRVDITVTNQNGTPINGANVKTLNVGNAIDEKLPDGHCQTYLSPGYYTLLVDADGYESASKSIVVEEGARNVVVFLEKTKENSGTGGGSSGDAGSTAEDWKIKSVSLGEGTHEHSGAITEDGNLYMWGYNSGGQVGNGTTTDCLEPTKILENVKSVSLGGYHSGAITEDGNLYTWGRNYYGQIGNGEKSYVCSKPTKVLENVKSVYISAQCSGAITEDGSLYIWGQNDYGQIGNGTTTDCLVPTKILDNVQSACLNGACNGAITEDGSLYMWGWNCHGQIGNGTTTDCLEPTKILENVKNVYTSGRYSAAITEDGSLYMWGINGHGQLGNGTTTESHVPIKITLPVQTESAEAYTESTDSNYRTQKVSSQSGTMPFSDLQANTTYNFYIMKSKDAVDVWQADNLLYVKQIRSDASGNATISYHSKEAYENADAVLVGSTQTDLSSATIRVPDLTYNGKEFLILGSQLHNWTVTLNGQTLVEGRDFDLEGTYFATDVGSYVVTVKGIGMYCGTKNATYSMLKEETGGDNNTGNNNGNNNTDNNNGNNNTNNNAGNNTSNSNTNNSTGNDNTNNNTEKDPAETAKVQINAFVKRMYTVALGREAEEAGLDDWSKQLIDHTNDGAGLARGFICSAEFTNKNLSNEAFVNTLYKTFFDRAADFDGKVYWIAALNRGTTRNEVLAGFVNSLEFANLCDKYGIARGTLESDGSSIYNAGVRNFVLRMYTKCLKRDGETLGVEDWSHRINKKMMSPEDVAKSFFSSAEFVNKNLSNEDYVETLYETFMDRPSDAGGKADWVKKLNSGVSRQTVLEGFSRSTEFSNIMKSYGL